jgi:hypothetical protein
LIHAWRLKKVEALMRLILVPTCFQQSVELGAGDVTKETLSVVADTCEMVCPAMIET